MDAAYEAVKKAAECTAKMVAASPDDVTRTVAEGYYFYDLLHCPRKHAMPSFRDDFKFEEALGPRGERLRASMERYDFETVSPVAKTIFVNMDHDLFGYKVKRGRVT